ncbi:hypothetical protein F8M41_023230 [Gigaspora margarita]|uniref:Uncharacterized protein n=1 Tax=Gigaspora margarita TaxID=4874 RepID=A0A8H4ADQ7_GIGMA|nr:hypothetical protein F8M41_023230 [Gigaspora margarita]
MSRRTEDITRSTTANIYACVSNLAEVTSELSTNTQELTTKLLEFQMKQEKANTEFLTILDKIQNQIKKLENSKHSTELDHKLSQMANTISEKITEDVEVIACDMTRFVDEVVNKAFENVLNEINKKSSEKALNEVEDDDDDDIEEDGEEIIDCAEDGRPMKQSKKKSHYLPVLRERIHIKINQHLDWATNKQKRKLSIAKNIGCEYVYNLEETPAALYNRNVTEEYVKFFLRELKENSKTSKGETWTASAIQKICIAYVTYLRKQHLLLDSNQKSVARTEKASELTFSHPFKEVLKILQIDCTSPEISEDEAEALTKKSGRKQLYVPEMSFRSEAAIRITEQIDHAIRVDESGERISGQVQPDERIRINQEDDRYSSLANEIPKFKINKLPPWAVCRGAIRTSSSASGSSGSES